MAAPSNKLYGKMWDSFVSTQENGSSKRFYFKANRKTLGSFKKRYKRFLKHLSV